jgi:hypothetical protein
VRVVLHGAGEVLRLGAPPFRKSVETFLRLRKELSERCPGAEYLDLRFRDRIYAKAADGANVAEPLAGSQDAEPEGAAFGAGLRPRRARVPEKAGRRQLGVARGGAFRLGHSPSGRPPATKGERRPAQRRGVRLYREVHPPRSSATAVDPACPFHREESRIEGCPAPFARTCCAWLPV